MNNRNQEGEGRRGGGSDGRGSPERGTPIRDNAKKGDNTVSYDRPTPQKPSKD